MTQRGFTLALFALSFTGCAPAVTIADGSQSAGEGGEATNGGQASGGTTQTGGASTGGSSHAGGGSNHTGGNAGSGASGNAPGGASGNGPGGAGSGGSTSAGGTTGGGGGAGVGECTGTVDEETSTSRQSLEAYCEERGGCPETLEQAQARMQELCGTYPPSGLFGMYGCNAIWVGYDAWAGNEDGGFVSGGYLFDEASRELVGAFAASDTAHGPCDAHTHVGGAGATCESLPVRRCDICSTGFGVDCRLDCDCTEPPGVDPCHDPTSCGCYCERLTGG